MHQLEVLRGQHRNGVTIETVDFTFSPSATCKKKRPPLSWHLRMEEQAEVENAWNIIRSGAQVQKVSEFAGRLPGTVKQTMHKVPLNGKSNPTNPRFVP